MFKPVVILIWQIGLAFCISECKSQNHANNWFFGNHAGISFNSGIPVPISGGQQNAFEGCSSYSDHNGNLLFYSDGVTVWNRNHVPMVNGTGILGGLSSTTSALIVQHPADCDLYFLFTVGDHLSSTKSLRYSIIDMSLSGGLGAVVVGSKNVLISNGCAEKITAIRHQNGIDYWIVTHYLSSSSFAAYRLTASGLLPVPVISSVGSFTASNCMIGFLKANRAGTKLVSVKTFCSGAEIFDFDHSSGAITNPQVILGNLNGAYGAEFSPNDSILYISKGFGGCALYQVNPFFPLTTFLVSSIGGDYIYGGLQLGPNGQIYMARNGQNFLSKVTNPNVWGLGCGFVSNGVVLSPGTFSGFGIVSFPPEQVVSFYPGGYSWLPTDTCYGDNTVFISNGILSFDSIVWIFGDPISGISNQALGTVANHIFSLPGNYIVNMIVYGCKSDTITRNVTILPCVLPEKFELNADWRGEHASLHWGDFQQLPSTFVLNRSRDGVYFEPFQMIPLDENVDQMEFVDIGPIGFPEIWYFVTQVFANGQSLSSNLVHLTKDAPDEVHFLVFPNPANRDENLSVKADGLSINEFKIDFLNALGEVVYHKNFLYNQHTSDIEIPLASFSSGIYMIRFVSARYSKTQRLIVK